MTASGKVHGADHNDKEGESDLKCSILSFAIEIALYVLEIGTQPCIGCISCNADLCSWCWYQHCIANIDTVAAACLFV